MGRAYKGNYDACRAVTALTAMPRKELIEERIELRRRQPLDRLPPRPQFHHGPAGRPMSGPSAKRAGGLETIVLSYRKQECQPALLPVIKYNHLIANLLVFHNIVPQQSARPVRGRRSESLRPSPGGADTISNGAH
jgi:hypothetical protein